MEYDANIGRTEGGASRGDFVVRASPMLSVLEDDGHFTWRLNYGPYYERAIQTDRIDAFSHYADGSLGYQLNDRTSFFANDHFSLADAVNTVTFLDDDGVSTISAKDEQDTRNQAQVGVRHSFTPRVQGNLVFTHGFFDSKVEDRARNQSYGGNANLRYWLSPRHQVGAGVATTLHRFEESNDRRRAPIDSLFVNLFGTWTWLIDETTTFEFTAGPTFIDSSQDPPPAMRTDVFHPTVTLGAGTFGFNASTCPTADGTPYFSQACSLDPRPLTMAELAAIAVSGGNMDNTSDFTIMNASSGSDTRWTVFGEVTLTKRWRPNLVSTFSYNRRDSTASGVGGSAVLDDVNLTTSWQISELWSTSMRADFTMRESTAPVQQLVQTVANTQILAPGDERAATTGFTLATFQSEVSTQRYGLAWRLTRQITKHLSVSARYTFARQESKSNSAASNSDFMDHLVTLGVQYDFDRWTLW